MNKSLRKTISTNITVQLLLAAVLLTIGLSLIFHGMFTQQKWAELRRSIDIISSYLYHDDPDMMCAYAQKLPIEKKSFHITLIAPDGSVRYDNTQDVHAMENQSKRMEVDLALTVGYGEAKQYATSLTKETYSVAKKLANDWILRLSDTDENLIGMLLQAGSWVVLCVALILCVSLMISRHFTKHVITPIEKMTNSDVWDDTYDELSPLIRRIQAQTDYIAKQNMAQESNTKAMQTLLSSMKEGVALLDKDGNILFINDSAKKYIGIGTEQADGKNIVEVTRQLAIHEGVHKALQGESLEWIHSYQDTSLQLSFSPVENNGAMILWMDVTHRIQAEKMRLEFTANVSHELKTPLTIISGYAELLHANMVRHEDRDTFIEKILQEASRLLLLIDDLLLLSHLREAATPFEMQETALLPIITHCVDAMQQIAKKKHVEIVTICPAYLALRASERMLIEMLHNLIENAVKYNIEGGHITVCAQLNESANTVEITVVDTGIGIPQDYQTRVFERFFRIDKSRSRKTGGTGLGLSIVKHIVEIHHGKITLDSREGIGTTITITFPRHSVKQA